MLWHLHGEQAPAAERSYEVGTERTLKIGKLKELYCSGTRSKRNAIVLKRSPFLNEDGIGYRTISSTRRPEVTPDDDSGDGQCCRGHDH
jgi:hypothetical protein